MAKHYPYLKPKDAAGHLRNLYPRTDPVKLTEQIREQGIAILLKNPDYANANLYSLGTLYTPTPTSTPSEIAAIKLLNVCNSALDSGDFGKHVEWIITAYAEIDESETGRATGGWIRGQQYAAGKEKARKFANEILATRKGKLTIKGLWRLVALKLDPDLSGEELIKETDNLRNQNKDLKPSD